MTVGSLGFDHYPNAPSAGNPTWLDPAVPAWVSQPLSKLARQSITSTSGHWWNPFSGLGSPLAANPHAGYFDPTNWISWIFPESIQWDVHILVAIYVGAIAVFSLTRLLGRTCIAATFSAVAFLYLGHFTTYGNHSNPVVTLCATPVLLAGVVALSKNSSLRAWFCTIIGTFWTLTAGFPETAFVSFLTVAGLCLCLATVNQADRARVLFRQAVSIGIGVLMASPYLLGLFEFVRQSFHTHTPELRLSERTETSQALVAWMSPRIFGRPFSQFFNGSFVGVREWTGLAVVILATIGAAIGGSPKARRLARYFVFLGLSILIYSYGLLELTPIRSLPIFDQVIPIWFLPLGALSLVLASAWGVDVVMERSLSVRHLLLPGAGLFFVVYKSHLPAKEMLKQLPSSEVLKAVSAGAAIILCIFLISSVAKRTNRNRYMLRNLLPGILLFVSLAIDLVPAARQNDLPQRGDPYSEPNWLTTVKKDGSFRTTDRFFGETAINFPQTNIGIGVRDIRMLDALYPQRYWDFVKTFIQPTIQTRFVGGPYSENFEPVVSTLALRDFVRFAGVSWFLTAASTESHGYDNLLRYLPDAAVDGLLVKRTCAGVRGLGANICGIFAHPPAEFGIPVPPRTKTLQIDFALLDEARLDPKSDGVEFVVVPRDIDGAELNPVMTEVINPKSDDTQFRARLFDLPPGTHSLILRTRSRGNSSTDWALWRSVTVDQGDFKMRRLKNLDAADKVAVYGFEQPAQQAWMVHNYDVVQDYRSSQAWLRDHSNKDSFGVNVPTFDVFREGVVESSRLSAQKNKDCGQSTILENPSTNHGQITFEVSTPCDGLLVTQNLFYPGWKSSVNGSDAIVSPVNGVFLAVSVPKGSSTVVIRFVPTYLTKSFIALGVAWLMIVALVLSRVHAVRRLRVALALRAGLVDVRNRIRDGLRVKR